MYRRATVIGIFSAKGGVGKTTTVVNLGMALAQRLKNRVLIVETNIMVSNLCLYFGITEPSVSIQDILTGKIRAEDAVMKYEGRLDILPGATGFVREPGPLDLSRFIDPLRRKYDIILLDTAPGFGWDVWAGLRVCDEIVIVCQPEIPSVMGALQTFMMAEEWKIPVIGVVVNRVTNKKYELPISDIKKSLGDSTISVIPEDETIKESVAKGIPVVLSAPTSSSAVEFARLARAILARIKGKKRAKYGARPKRSRWVA